MKIGKFNAAILGEKRKMAKKKRLSLLSYRCCVYKISAHKSKIWALHGLISSQILNYTKFKL